MLLPGGPRSVAPESPRRCDRRHSERRSPAVESTLAPQPTRAEQDFPILMISKISRVFARRPPRDRLRIRTHAARNFWLPREDRCKRRIGRAAYPRARPGHQRCAIRESAIRRPPRSTTPGNPSPTPAGALSRYSRKCRRRRASTKSARKSARPPRPRQGLPNDPPNTSWLAFADPKGPGHRVKLRLAQ
jgi:hypothetical protein